MTPEHIRLTLLWLRYKRPLFVISMPELPRVEPVALIVYVVVPLIVYGFVRMLAARD